MKVIVYEALAVGMSHYDGRSLVVREGGRFRRNIHNHHDDNAIVIVSRASEQKKSSLK